MIINKVVLVVQWCYWLFSHGLKFYWIYCSLKWMPDHAKECPFDVIEVILPARKWKLLWRIWISQDVNGSLKTLLNVYNYADILAEGAFPAIECRLAHMNVFSHCCLTFSANDCVLSLIERSTKTSGFCFDSFHAETFQSQSNSPCQSISLFGHSLGLLTITKWPLRTSNGQEDTRKMLA